MGRKEVLAKRHALEEYYYNCKFETPEEVAKQFEVYTKLIWEFHQAGLVYDYYYDETKVNQEGATRMKGGVDVTEIHTIPSFATYPNCSSDFYEIYCVGNPEHGYCFGQVTTKSGSYPKGAPSMKGVGTGIDFNAGDQWNFCQCYVNKIEGRWVVTDEWLCYGNEINRRRLDNSRPYYKSILEKLEDLGLSLISQKNEGFKMPEADVEEIREEVQK